MVFTSNFQCVCLAAKRRVDAGDATDQWRDQPNAAALCPTQWQWGVYTIQQTSSKLPANVFKIHVLMLNVCWIVLIPHDCRESSTLIGHLLKGIPNSIID